MAKKRQEISRNGLTFLVAKKNMLFQRLEKLCGLVDKFPDEEAVSEFKALISILSESKSEFEKVIDEINKIKAECGENCDFSELEKFYNKMYAVKKAEEDLHAAGQSLTKGNVFKLPKLELPVFDGSLQNWPLFKETFERVIHLNPSLSADAKVQYLVGKLSGRAKQTISSLPATATNYELMWKRLCEKYQDEKKLAKFYFKEIMSFKPIVKESAGALEMFLEQFVTAFEALKNLKIPNLADFLILQLAFTKIDAETLKSFEMHVRDDKIPTFEQLTAFVRQQVRILDKPKDLSFERGLSKGYTRAKPNSFLINASKNNAPVREKCDLCKDIHPLYECPKFLALSPQERLQHIKKHKRCFNCLSLYHALPNCKSKNSCATCRRSHHSLLHIPKASFNENLESNSKPTVTLHNKSLLKNDIIEETVLLPTASVLVGSKNQKLIRILLDSGSQTNLITDRCCRVLGLPRKKFSSSLYGVGNAPRKVLGKTSLTFSPHFNKEETYSVDALIVDEISGDLPSVRTKGFDKNFLKNVQLADFNFDIPNKIDAIIGAELYPKLVKQTKFAIPNTSCYILDTALGFVVMGKTPTETHQGIHSNFLVQEEPIEPLIKKFWEIENFTYEKSPNVDAVKCEEMFIREVSRNTEGRFIVKLPFCESPSLLGSSLNLAKNRFFALEKKLEKSKKFKLEYSKVIQEFLDKNYLREVHTENISLDEGYFVPHHAVWKPDSATTPLRIVFDASAKTSSGKSLNDILHTGEKLHSDPILVLLNFRIFEVALTADIRQMYMQILLHPQHTKFQRIFWRFDSNAPLKILELSRIAFGLRSSPFLALRVTQELIKEEFEKYPLARDYVPRDMYVDDVICSVNNVEKACKLQAELVALFNSGGFELSKWTTNSKKLFNQISDSRVNQDTFSFTFGTCHKVLGLRWNPIDDSFFFEFKIISEVATKRNILSMIARMFDPLGFISPMILIAKNLIKQLWKEKIGWDEEPSKTIKGIWSNFLKELKLISCIKIPRHVLIFESSIIDLIGFCDGSEIGYGAVVYVRTFSKTDSSVKLSLLCSKSRITPIKSLSIPRLELCAALLLSQLLKFVLSCLDNRVAINKIFALSDSQIVLHWINASPDRWKTFVSNRITQIQENLSKNVWHYVPTKDNPADIVSRGAWASRLKDNKFWWQGPSWLKEPYAEWPISKVSDNLELGNDLEVKVAPRTLSVFTQENSILRLCEKISSWPKLLRILCYVLRFGKIITSLNKPLSAYNIDTAEHILIKCIQKIYFEKELKLLKEDKLRDSSLKKLSLFIDEGLIRVGGRLQNAMISYSKKHPILLPKNCPIVNLIIDYHHKIHFHPGTNLLISILRQKYWIVNVRSLVKRRISKCVNCFKVNPQPFSAKMADLPDYRVNSSRPFSHSGVDYAGPFFTTLKRARGQKTQKTYLCLFVCMATKAVHLEVVCDLSSVGFINAFKRFIARRGFCEVIYSDNGTNFVGAKGLFDEMYKFIKSDNFTHSLGSYLSEKRIKWHFNPPSAPHFGGLWESLIKSVKRHLFKSIGAQILAIDEFATLITQIEAVINSRPLSSLSEDPSDPHPLTPSHFLTAKPLLGFPTLSNINSKELARPKLIEDMLQSFWKRWSLEYLHHLQTREKWNSTGNPISEGILVLLMDNTPPLNWQLGIITKVFPGKDGVIRVAEVKTKRGTYTRPIVKLCPLPKA